MEAGGFRKDELTAAVPYVSFVRKSTCDRPAPLIVKAGGRTFLDLLGLRVNTGRSRPRVMKGIELMWY